MALVALVPASVLALVRPWPWAHFLPNLENPVLTHRPPNEFSRASPGSIYHFTSLVLQKVSANILGPEHFGSFSAQSRSQIGPKSASCCPRADSVEMSGVFREDGLAADTADVLAADTIDVLSAAKSASGGAPFYLWGSISSESAPGKTRSIWHRVWVDVGSKCSGSGMFATTFWRTRDVK